MKHVSSPKLLSHSAQFCRRKTSTLTKSRVQNIPLLSNGTIQLFREQALDPALPYLLPRGYFSYLPAISKWFEFSLNPLTRNVQTAINAIYLTRYGTTNIALELTRPHAVNSQQPQFERFDAPLNFFLTYLQTRQDADPAAASEMPSLYLAQLPLNSLPVDLNTDLPTPELVSLAGRGDVYDSSIWIGPAPTYTPLHRDPNPNLFIQLAGTKKVRILHPDIGLEVFISVRKRIGGRAKGYSTRGDEMMMGEERQLLEEAIWEDGMVGETHGFEAEMGPGDGLFIPLGWWHSIKGIGSGVVGSVNWWFR